MFDRDPLDVLREQGVSESLLQTALTHTSYANENPGTGPANERLEFLGDAVLELIVSQLLFERFPEAQEGDLTRMRAHLVQTESLAALARELRIGGHVRLGYGEKQADGARRSSLLADTFEALVGALFVSAGFVKTRRVIRRWFEPRLRSLNGEAPVDPKSNLQEMAQKRGQGEPVYRVVDMSGPDHARVFQVEVILEGESLAVGSGPSKQAAERKAAARALRKCSASVQDSGS